MKSQYFSNMVIVHAMKMNALRIYAKLQKQNSERQMQQWDGGICIGDAMGVMVMVMVMKHGWNLVLKCMGGHGDDGAWPKLMLCRYIVFDIYPKVRVCTKFQFILPMDKAILLLLLFSH